MIFQTLKKIIPLIMDDNKKDFKNDVKYVFE